MLASMRTRGVGGAIIVLGAFAGVLPFVGPLFGFGLTSDAEAWTVTDDRIILSVIPGAAAVIGGMLLQGRRVSIQRTGALLGLAKELAVATTTPAIRPLGETTGAPR